MNKNTIEFLRAQTAALISTCIDYLTVIGFTELAGLWYIYSNIIGASLGAISNFFLGRNWAFNAQKGMMGHQAGRYALVAFGSLVLNTVGMYGFTEALQFNYIISKIIVGILIGVCFNYVLQKHFVFKKVS